MDDNKNNFSFEFEPSMFKILFLSYRFCITYRLPCCTDIIAFVSLVSLSDSPIFKSMIDLGLDELKIRDAAAKVFNEYGILNVHQPCYMTLNIPQLNIFVNLSKPLYDILGKATIIAKNVYQKNAIGYNELAIAFAETLPEVYQSFIKNCATHFGRSTESTLKNEDILNVPTELSSCLTIFNSKFSPDEEECTILGRDEETRTLIRTLAKDTKRNAVLVGEAGVGKTAIVEKLTWLIVTGNCPEKFKDYSVVSLDVNSIIAGTQYRGSAEERFKQLIAFLEDYPKCILFIDEIHNLLGAGACREGDLDLANVLKPILARNTTQVIGATTLDEYNKYFSKDSALKRRFKPIEVKEPKIHEVYPMIKNQIKRLSKSHGVTISKEIVDMIIFYASCFNKETKNPDRSLDLVDIAMAAAELAGKKEVSREDVLDNFNLNYKIFENTPNDIKVGLAYHEAGHYIVHLFSDELYNYKTTALSIMPAENYYGAHVYDVDEDVIPSRTLEYYIQLVGCKLGGRVAEEMYSKKLSAGASEDLKNATELARAVVTQYGLIETFSRNRVYSFGENSLPLTREKSIQIDNEVDFLLEKGRMYAKYILKHHEDDLDLLVNTLLEKRMMSGEELDELFKSSEKVILTDSTV